jgi:hypothetical protein
MEKFIENPALIVLAIIAIFTLLDGWKRIPNPYPTIAKKVRKFLRLRRMQKNKAPSVPAVKKPSLYSRFKKMLRARARARRISKSVKRKKMAAQPQQTTPPPTPTRRSYGQLVARTITVLIFAAITLLLMVVWGTSPAESKMINTIAVLVILSLPTLAFSWFAYEASKKNLQATTVAMEEFKFVVAGESLHKILPNLKGAGLDKDDRVTINPKMMCRTYFNPLLEFLRAKLGVFWVSIIYPLRKIHKFKIDKYRLVQGGTLPTNHQMSDLVAIEPDVEVDSLRRFIPRPTFINEVELKDGIPVDIVVMTEYEVIIPRIPIFSLKGKFFPLLDAAIEAAVNDVGNAVTYMQLITTPTGKGSGFSDTILKMVADHLERTVGIRPTSCYIVQLGLLAADQAVKDATKAQEVETLKGKGVIAAADAKAQAITLLADANARTFVAAFDALTGKGVDPNVAVHNIGRVLAFREIAGIDSTIQTFVEAGAAVGVTIPTSPTRAPATTTTP